MNTLAEPLIAERKSEIAELCRRNRVKRLRVFGSATGKEFSDESDFDFLVSFAPGPIEGLADSYLALAQGLESILGRRVDLVTEDSIRNPYFRESVEASCELVYDGRSPEMAV